MKKRYLALIGTAALVSMAACTDRQGLTETGRGIAPHGPSRTNNVNGASFTTTNIHDDPNPSPSDHDLCQNATDAADANNCNLYFNKSYVWLDGGPATASLGDGTYFFAVLDPGGQANPNDGAPDNLSDGLNGDYTTRTFSISNGVVTYAKPPGTHDVDGNLIRLADYDNTSNPGGVYILAVCSLANGTPVKASDCKYDAFKIASAGTCNPDTDPNCTPDNKAEDLTGSKDAAGKYNNTYTWGITKAVDKTRVEQVGGQVTFTYTVTITHDNGTITGVKVTGQIHVLNPNSATVTIDGITDALSDGVTTCTVSNAGAGTVLAANSITDFDYSCDLGSTVPTTSLDNVAIISWSTQTLSDGKVLDGGNAHAVFEDIVFTGTIVDGSVTVTDIFNNTPPATTIGSVSYTDPSPTSLTSYTRIVNVPQNGCVDYKNTATFTTSDTKTTGSADKTVTVCGPARTGALTMGFWKGPNGNNLINTFCAPAGGTSLATYLSSLSGVAATGPFADAAPKSCADLVKYVNAIIGAASATDMNKMLKAQMLATALDVYFSSFGYTTTPGGTVKNPIKPPSNFLPNGGIGGFVMDLRAVCPMVDDATTGAATCKSGLPSTDAFASGAVPWASNSISNILKFAATLDVSPWATGAFTGTASSSTWYGTDRTKQEILKNIFDQINNQNAFAAP